MLWRWREPRPNSRTLAAALMPGILTNSGGNGHNWFIQRASILPKEKEYGGGKRTAVTGSRSGSERDLRAYQRHCGAPGDRAGTERHGDHGRGERQLSPRRARGHSHTFGYSAHRVSADPTSDAGTLPQKYPDSRSLHVPVLRTGVSCWRADFGSHHSAV